MLYISNVEFVDKCLSESVNIDDILVFSQVAKKLVTKYGSQVKKQEFIDKVRNVNEDLSNYIKLLAVCNKLDSKIISDIQRLFKIKSKNYSKSFDMVSSNPSSIVSKVESKLKDLGDGVTVVSNSGEKIGLEVKGEGFYYTRSIDNDLDKLLN
ncbi:MAG: hypothetical protein V3575_01615 [Candidatus Absconditabacteria bacterium]